MCRVPKPELVPRSHPHHSVALVSHNVVPRLCRHSSERHKVGVRSSWKASPACPDWSRWSLRRRRRGARRAAQHQRPRRRRRRLWPGAPGEELRVERSRSHCRGGLARWRGGLHCRRHTQAVHERTVAVECAYPTHCARRHTVRDGTFFQVVS